MNTINNKDNIESFIIDKKLYFYGFRYAAVSVYKRGPKKGFVKSIVRYFINKSNAMEFTGDKLKVIDIIN